MPLGCGHLASQFQRRGIIHVLPIITKHCYILNAGFRPGGFKEHNFLVIQIKSLWQMMLPGCDQFRLIIAIYKIYKLWTSWLGRRRLFYVFTIVSL